jgi:hypothetical protein
MTRIVLTRDWRTMLASCRFDDLEKWHEQWVEIDWPATLRQSGWYLLTDRDGSYCLLEPCAEDVEAHLIIARHNRGKLGVEIAEAMLAWIDMNIGPARLWAKPAERKVALFLRRIGFSQCPDDLARWYRE